MFNGLKYKEHGKRRVFVNNYFAFIIYEEKAKVKQVLHDVIE